MVCWTLGMGLEFWRMCQSQLWLLSFQKGRITWM